MKQKLLISDKTWNFKNNYVPVMTPMLDNVYVSRGYVITPTDKDFFSKIFTDDDREVILTINPKKDPRRSKSTKNYNSLLLSFKDLVQDTVIKSDFTINMSNTSDTQLSLLFNQFLLPLKNSTEKQEKLTLTLNGSLGSLKIDRSNPFKVINIVGNNIGDLYQSENENSVGRRSKINIVDNTVEELNLLVDKNVTKDKQQNYYFNSVQSYSLKKLKIEAHVIELNSRLEYYKLMNLQEIDMSNVGSIHSFYNNFFAFLSDKDDDFKNHFNSNCKIILNPAMTYNTGYDWNGDKLNNKSLKEMFNIKSNDIFEISMKDLISVLRKEKNINSVIKPHNKEKTNNDLVR